VVVSSLLFVGVLPLQEPVEVCPPLLVHVVVIVGGGGLANTFCITTVGAATMAKAVTIAAMANAIFKTVIHVLPFHFIKKCLGICSNFFAN
jgi:hypothetical protein